MRRILIPVLCLAALGLFTAGANAGSALNLLRLDGRINSLEDLDYETLIDTNKSGTVDTGDYLLGMWQVQGVNYTPIAPPPTFGQDAFTAIFLLKVKTATQSGSDWIFEFEAASTSDWSTYTGTSVNMTNGGTLGVLYSDSVKDFGADWIDPTQSILNSLATAKGTPLWEVGFKTGASDQFWMAKTDSNLLTSVTTLDYAAALNVTHTYAGAGGVLLSPHQHLTSAGGFSFTGLTQFQIEGSKGSHDPGNFALPTDTDIHIKPTPEPGSLALLGLGLAAVGGIVYRRRRKA